VSLCATRRHCAAPNLLPVSFACHATNATAQSFQLFRFVNYHHLGGGSKAAALEKGTEKIV
jgi:hypothetical protein